MRPPHIPLYRYEFPDFGSLDIVIPDGFLDSSWHNDLSPSWYDETRRLKLWVDYADPDKREKEIPRFALQRYTAEDEFESEIIASDNYRAILAEIARSR